MTTMGPSQRHQSETRDTRNPEFALRFVDLFAGCGGLSLGLIQSHWTGLFAIEKDSDAFSSFKHNLLDVPKSRFFWPHWLAQEQMEIQTFVENYRGHIAGLRGKVELIVGGPPCQGFSLAGKRNSRDPRNLAFKHYVDIVDLVEPPLLLFENVPGIKARFAGGMAPEPFSVLIRESLEKQYLVFDSIVKAVDFGVAQVRPRHFMIGINKKVMNNDKRGFELNPFDLLWKLRPEFLCKKGLSVDHPISVGEAISDLEILGTSKLIDSGDTRGYKQINYLGPKTRYQQMLHAPLNGASPNSLRLARHRPPTIRLFQELLRTCRKGTNLSAEERSHYGIRKSSLKILDKSRPSPTLTTLPDDIIHYSEPRILTVRESARLQSFPDWFEFRGKYTTGGARRVHECPRYTQVANAVPPLLAEALGYTLGVLWRRLGKG